MSSVRPQILRIVMLLVNSNVLNSNLETCVIPRAPSRLEILCIMEIIVIRCGGAVETRHGTELGWQGQRCGDVVRS